MKIKTVISVLTFAQMLSFALAVPHDLDALQEENKTEASASDPQCETIRTSQLTLTCAYTGDSSVNAGKSGPRITLNGAVISFDPSNESHMHVDLSFTNNSGSAIVDQRTAYLAIDDEKGDNHMRRPLPEVDFTKLKPGRATKFQQTLLAPAFSSGTYTVSIWIPSTDPSLKFDPTHNFLLSSKGVPVPATGLNQIGKFTITGRHKPEAK